MRGEQPVLAMAVGVGAELTAAASENERDGLRGSMTACAIGSMSRLKRDAV